MAERGGPAAWDDPSGFDDLDQEPTPALLAAKAEPLGAAGPANRPGRKPPRSNRPNGPSRPAKGPRGPQGRAGGRRKPKEPSKLLLGLGVVAVLVSGFGAAYLFSKISGEDTAEQTADGGPAASVDDTGDPADTGSLDGQDTPSDSLPDQQPAGPAAGVAPSVSFDEAAVGPINADTGYNIGVVDGPADAQYQYLVDGQPQGEPAATPAPVVFTPGRHLLEIQITSPAGGQNPPPVVVYAVGPVPAEAVWRANLSSVSMTDPSEGWIEAMAQFDAYVAAGHTDLQLMPSDRYPGLAPGYWNLFVPQASDAAAVAYCESHNLAVPDACFPKLADPNAPAGG